MATSEEGEVVSKPRVSIRSLNGRTCHFDVTEDTTVEQLKHIIAEEVEVPVERQRLLFQGKILTDGQLLKDAGCFNKVVHLVKRAELPSNTSNPPPTASVSDTPTAPLPGATGAGVVFGGFPFMGAQQIFNNVWTMTPPTTTATPTSTGPSPGTNANSSQPTQGARPIRTVPGILWETRHLLQICGDALDRFDRGESMNIQDSSQSSPPGPPPSVSVSSSLLGDLYQTLVTVYERLIPLLREEARFLQEDRDLGEEETARRDRVSDCVRAVLERLHVCKIHLMNVSVSTSQPPPRTIQPVTRNRRRVTPHMTHVQVHINPSHHTQSNVTSSTTTSSDPTPSAPATGESSSSTTTPAPVQDPPPQPVMASSPADLTNIFAQALSSIFPVNLPADGAVPHNITGEAVIIQNGVVNSIPFGPGAGAGPMPSLFPPGLSIIELARSLYPGFIDDPGEDIFSRLLLLLCGMFTVDQLRGIVNGRVECLQGMYQRVKEFVTNVLVTGSEPAGEEQRRRGGELLATSTVENIKGLFEALPSQENLNFKEVFVKFFKSHFYTAITLILDSRNEDIETSNNENRFGKVIWGWGHNMIRELCQLLDILARAGGTDIHSVLERFLVTLIQNEGSGDIPLDFIRGMLRDSRDKIDLIIRSSRLTDQQIKDKYLTTVTSASSLSQPDTLVPACTDWLPQEWKECIEEDSHTPAANQACFSNSYMNFSGLTDNKDQKVACSVEDMLCETLQQSITTSQVQPTTSIDEVMHDVRQNSTLKKRYNEFIDSNLTKRIRSDPNHTAERFPNSTARFKSDKS